MARNPYDNGHRRPDSRPRDSLHQSAYPGEYSDDLDEGRFQQHPMQRAAGDFAQSAPQPRGSQYPYEAQDSPYGYGSQRRGEQARYGMQEGRRGTDFPSARGATTQGSPYTQQRARNRGPRNWQRSDERIREDICERLSSLDDVDVSDVSVSVQEGRVMLTGTVLQRGDKHRIEDVADDSIGVRDVDNQIRVRRDDERSSGGFWSQLFGFDSGAKARDVMTREVLVVSPGDSVQRAAQVMKDADIGSVPVCDGQRLQGMVTDRDIAVRVVAAGLPADSTQASQAMTSEVFWCYEDDDVADVLDKMGDRQVRRIPVVDRDHKLSGIISLGDVAVQRSGGQVQEALEEISTPSSAEPMTGATSSASASSMSSTRSPQRH